MTLSLSLSLSLSHTHSPAAHPLSSPSDHQNRLEKERCIPLTHRRNSSFPSSSDNLLSGSILTPTFIQHYFHSQQRYSHNCTFGANNASQAHVLGRCARSYVYERCCGARSFVCVCVCEGKWLLVRSQQLP